MIHLLKTKNVDIRVSSKEIEKRFGKVVKEIVSNLSEKKRANMGQ